MVRLQFGLNPHVKGEWYEHHYSGAVHVIEGITEDISEDVANILLARGFDPIPEQVVETPEPEEPKKVSKTPPRTRAVV